MKQEKEKLKLPNGYVDKLSEKVWKKIKQSEIYEELNAISSFIATHLKRKNLFKVPDNYFETLPLIVRKKIQIVPLKIYSIKSNIAFMLSAAAIMMIIALPIFLLQTPKSTSDNFAQIEDKTLITALTLESDKHQIEMEVVQDKEVLDAVAESIETKTTVQEKVLEQEVATEKNLEYELEKALESELESL